VTEKGRKVLYVLLAKALYGTIRAALLFYRKLAETLVSWGFAINPYDPCVANKMVDGKQCTVMWHVDDLKISHVRLSVVKDVIGKLKKVFGSEAPLTEWIGKVHDYLGMRIDYSAPGKVSISQRDYIEEILGELPKDMAGLATSPAAAHLFEVSSAPDLLPVEAAEMFHCNVAKLLFVSQRSRPDIQTAVAFLSTRVKAPDRDDYKKLRRVMQYLRGSLDLTRTMEADGTGIARWWIDASFAVHPNMRGHTGGVPGKRCRLHDVERTEDQYSEFNRIRARGSVRRACPGAMDSAFPRGTGIRCQGLRYIPGQYEHHPPRRERQGLEQQAHTTHQHSVFLCY
jgi:hypothetical protein